MNLKSLSITTLVLTQFYLASSQLHATPVSLETARDALEEAAAPTPASIDLGELERKLKTEGVEGWLHAVVESQGLVVFTVRDPNDFFNNAQFPLVSHVPAVASVLTTLKRHDKIRIKGQFINNRSPQRHIYVTTLEVIQAWNGTTGSADYDYAAKIPADLLAASSALFKVHAVDAGGAILVVEYKDAVIPVFVTNTSVSQGLYRGDKIRLHYKVRTFPGRPTHLQPDEAAAAPIEVLDRLVEKHEKPAELTGILSLYPQSPQIIFDIYALHHTDADGISLEYTLVNFENQDVFTAIREKLGAAWNSPEVSGSAVNGRNKLFNPKILVHAKGVFNVVSPNQANPQILLTSADDVTITILP